MDPAPSFGDMRHPDRRRALALWRFLETDRYLVRRKYAFLGTVQRRLHNRAYDGRSAPVLWAHWVDEGIRRYRQAHPRTDPDAFAGRLRFQLAREIARHEYDRILQGDYPDLTVQGGMVGDKLSVVRW